MVVVQDILDSVASAALDAFDSFTHIALGDDNTPPTVSDTALGNEFIRKTFEESIKNTSVNTFLFEIKLGLSEGNGNTIREIGIFDAASGGTLGVHNLTNEVAKTSDKEVVIDLQVSVSASNV